MAPLSFGNGSAALHRGLHASTEAMAQVVPTLRIYEAEGQGLFRSKSAVARIGAMRIVANSSDACRIDVDESAGWHLLAPAFGRPTLAVDGREYRIKPMRQAMLLPNTRRSTHKPDGSFTIVSLDQARLSETIAVMATGQPGGAALRQVPQLLDNSDRADLILAFQRILHLVDLGQYDPEICATLSVDVLLYRWVAAALTALPAAQDRSLASGTSMRLDLVCDAVRAAWDRPLTLTEMEQIAGHSARSLQYAFRTRFGCSPMQWQRQERMLFAR